MLCTKNYYGFVYLWRDRKRKMMYIGSHYGQLDDGYVGSSAYFRRAYDKRPQDFRRRILSYVKINDRKILLKEEERWLQMIKPQDLQVRYYNIKRRGTGGFVTEGYNIMQKEQYREKLRQRPSKGAKQWKARACFCIDKEYATCTEAARSIGFNPQRRLHGRKYANFYYIDEGPLTIKEIENANTQRLINKRKCIEAMRKKNLELSQNTEYHKNRCKKGRATRIKNGNEKYSISIENRPGRKISINGIIFNNLKYATILTNIRPWKLRQYARDKSILDIFFIDR